MSDFGAAFVSAAEDWLSSIVTRGADPIERSHVALTTRPTFYTIDDTGKNILSIGWELPTTAEAGTHPATDKYRVLTSTRDGAYSVESEVFSTLNEADTHALSIAEDNRNNAYDVHVLRGLNYRFAGRPVYQCVHVFMYLSRSEQASIENAQLDEFTALEKSSELQSILFPTEKYTVAQARAWLSSHGKKAGKVDTPGNFHRFRQFDPDSCKTTPRTITLGSGIKAVVCNRTGAGDAPASVQKEDDLEEGEGGGEELDRASMTTASINDLPDSAFAYIESGGSKDSDGKTTPRNLRHFPVHDAAHTRNALARVSQSPFGKKALPKILAAAKKFGIQVSGDGDGNGSKKSVDITIFKSFIERGLVYGIVYAPYDLDTHGDWTSPEEIERAAHEFLPRAVLNLQHTDELAEDVKVVESYIAPVDFEFSNGARVSKGSWVIVTHVKNQALIDEIEKGEKTGYSLEGYAKKIETW